MCVDDGPIPSGYPVSSVRYTGCWMEIRLESYTSVPFGAADMRRSYHKSLQPRASCTASGHQTLPSNQPPDSTLTVEVIRYLEFANNNTGATLTNTNPRLSLLLLRSTAPCATTSCRNKVLDITCVLGQEKMTKYLRGFIPQRDGVWAIQSVLRRVQSSAKG